jgi:hypothetical protein
MIQFERLRMEKIGQECGIERISILVRKLLTGDIYGEKTVNNMQRGRR